MNTLGYCPLEPALKSTLSNWSYRVILIKRPVLIAGLHQINTANYLGITFNNQQKYSIAVEL